jgi:hypothetical protein
MRYGLSADKKFRANESLTIALFGGHHLRVHNEYCENWLTRNEICRRLGLSLGQVKRILSTLRGMGIIIDVQDEWSLRIRPTLTERGLALFGALLGQSWLTTLPRLA